MKHFTFLLVALLFAGQLIAQFDKRSHNLNKDGNDTYYDILEHYDGGIIAIGTDISDYHNAIISKRDVNLEKLWLMKYRGPGESVAGFKNVLPESDGSLVLSGNYKILSNSREFILFAKVNSCGEMEWSKVQEFYHTITSDIVKLEDGSYIGMASGIDYWMENDSMVLKTYFYGLTGTGEVTWVDSLNRDNLCIHNSVGMGMELLTDGNLLITLKERYFSTSGRQYWGKFTQNIELLWQECELLSVYEAATGVASNGSIYSLFHSNLTENSDSEGIALLNLNNSGEIQYLNLLNPCQLDGYNYSTALLIYNDSTLITGYSSAPADPYAEKSSYISVADTLGNIRQEIVNNCYFCNTPGKMIRTGDDKVVVIESIYDISSLRKFLFDAANQLVADTIYTQPVYYDFRCDHPIVDDTIYFNPTNLIPVGISYPQDNLSLRVFPNPFRKATD